ncbi:MAG TPA: redoxin family protein [Candidatus Sulfotelmatobacter sp.]|nr:redoxin family protein [Candidatus Sulfotelmatobacter sp.]
MNRWLFACAATVAFAATIVFGQSPSSSNSSEGLDLLKRAARHYAEAKSYRIEFVEERSYHGDDGFDQNWQKAVVIAAEAPGNRFHYEGRSSGGAVLRVSDGKTVWKYHPDDHRYTEKLVGDTSGDSKFMATPDFAAFKGEHVRKDLSEIADHFKSATRLKDERVSIAGRKIDCYVVHFQTRDTKGSWFEDGFDKKIWIEKAHETIVKVVEHQHTHLMMSGGSAPTEMDTTTSYSVVNLDRPAPEEFFTFTPPADAKLVEHFADPSNPGPDLSGDLLPSLQFKSADGKPVSLDSFRGRPILLDVWATWCAPCVKGLEKIAKLYSEAQGKDLVVISVDKDEEAKTATDLLTNKGYTWQNFHDEGQIDKALGYSGVSRTLLIDAQGKIVYDASGGKEDDLRGAVAKLGPEYAALAPQPQQAPCNGAN